MRRSVAGLLAVFCVRAAGAAEVKSIATVVITGGPYAGTHTAQTASGGCSSTGGGKFWGNQLSVPEEPKKLNSVQLFIQDIKSAPDRFTLTVAFGWSHPKSVEYKVDTQGMLGTKTGTGKVTIEDHGKTAKMLFDVKTAEGIRLEGTIDCKSIFKM